MQMEDFEEILLNDKTIQYSFDDGVFEPNKLLKLLNEKHIKYESLKDISTSKLFGWWQQIIKKCIFNSQTPARNMLTGTDIHNYDVQLHHALISRNDVRGIRDVRKYLIHHSYNVMLLDRDTHLGNNKHLADNKELCAKVLCERWGKQNVMNWYFNFPFKVKLKNIFE